ncbi:MAG: hypothetical protein ROO76_15355 [Terriglobia bacterium]|jgi:hypothetical protein|nr:hypothetical protein [Terriglobia bacterium]
MILAVRIRAAIEEIAPTPAVAAPKQKQQALKVGKRGEITLTKPTNVDAWCYSRTPMSFSTGTFSNKGLLR